jgi:hypothetical protein
MQQKTRRGDNLTSLARAYATSVDEILLANDMLPSSRHSDRYLSEKAREYLIPSNLPRAQLSKLVLEYDIQRWARGVGAECADIRHGSQTQVAKLLSCPPGHYCRFDADCEIVLPTNQRTLAGLGAVTSVDVALQLNDLKARARATALAIVDDISSIRLIDKPRAEAWKNAFISQVGQLVDAALKKGANGKHNFERDPSLVTRINTFVKTETDEARAQFSFSANVEALVNSLRGKSATLTASLTSTAVPAPAPAKQNPSAFRSTSTTLADVRSGKSRLERGQSGAGVRELQTLLTQKGHSLVVDGLFGPVTETTIKAFQTGAKLPATGRCDQPTLQALEAPVLPTISTAVQSSGGVPPGLIALGALGVIVVGVAVFSD